MTPDNNLPTIHSDDFAPVYSVESPGRVYSFMPLTRRPTQKGPKGIYYDFNDGARILLPEGQWRVHLIDAESGNLLFACETGAGWVISAKKFYIPFRLVVWDKSQTIPVLDYTLNLKDQPVLVKFPEGCNLGDLIGWFSYCERFQQKHQCRLECLMDRKYIDLLAGQYPDLALSTHGECQAAAPYATYQVGLFFDDPGLNHQPIDFRQAGLHRTAAYILGVDVTEAPPRLDLSAPRQIPEPYVCVAAKATSQAKFWNSGFGWDEVIAYLKQLGYRVLCIDQHRTVGHSFVWNHLPHGAEDITGDIPLQERVNLLKDADLFIGLSSGLSWLAWTSGVPVILISGFTLPNCEFYTPYRVFSKFGCAGCWNDLTIRFDLNDFLHCPRHQNTERQFECTRLITAPQVIGHIDRLMADRDLAAPTKFH